jgi:uncharacterized protein (TIGR02284 family)
MAQSKKNSQAGGASAASSPSTSGSTEAIDAVVSKATTWLNKGNVTELLGRVPQSVKGLGTQTAARFNKLSTTQKVVGGALLVAGGVGVGYLVRSGALARGNSASAAPSAGAPAGTSGDQTDEAVDTLHELLHFVNDRIAGYEHAVAESKDPELRGYYKQLVSQSQRFANDLNDHLRRQGEDRETATTAKGKLYRSWMDTKAAITGTDEKAILGSNIYGEEWALKAYEDALSDQTLTGTLRLEVERQYEHSQKTYKKLQKLQDKQ